MLDTFIDTYEHKIGPQNEAVIVARAWREPDFRVVLFKDATAVVC